MLKDGINNVTNKEYHSDKVYLSSSNLKMILKNPAQFYDEKILGNKVPDERAVFDEGSYTHSLILEPEKIAEEYAFFEGFRKQGKEWEAFKEENKGKTLLSAPQKHRCHDLLDAYNRRPEAINFISGGLVEHTLCGKLLDVPVKVRFDYINIEKGYIADIKTTGYPADIDIFKNTVKDFGYELSAALYSEVAKQFYKKSFDFYFIVLSKPERVCDVYKASETTLNTGKVMVYKALKKYKTCLETGIWEDSELKKSAELKKSNYEILEV